jgi:hypothetical protein
LHPAPSFFTQKKVRQAHENLKEEEEEIDAPRPTLLWGLAPRASGSP